MIQIPRSALWLGIAGLTPFLWGAATQIAPSVTGLMPGFLGPLYIGPYIQVIYGQVILSFMSGVLWGFSARAQGQTATVGYTLSVIPALWVFFATNGTPDTAAINLIFGFIGVLGLDWLFWQHQLAPKWWLKLRIILTLIVVTCLGVGLFYG
ncbi:DUF3429 domain-containing protein [Parasulfitobacter algicola]|uniref:DUF3429 domain-containing protein n=1 Tax=Parasulfitobacter algicola TaxID=2614809 RepID=A0ABX2IM44_9RHOB|nr:DUF3429 domain-containing protein [Sulfitobacter algicola]NSX53944.1 DUF3429 domain-containing protein [Sulfitobacter algicola]